MAFEIEFTAQDNDELTETLRTWGDQVPERTNRRGKQVLLERFTLNRFLKLKRQYLMLDFPITVMKGENPDFMVLAGCKMVGIEIVTGCDKDEQKSWTERAKQERKTDEISGKIINLEDPRRPRRPRLFSDIINTTIEKKCKKCSSCCDELLIYTNTHTDSFEDANWKLNALSSLPECMDRFTKVWVLSGKDLIELRERKIYTRDPTDFDS